MKICGRAVKICLMGPIRQMDPATSYAINAGQPEELSCCYVDRLRKLNNVRNDHFSRVQESLDLFAGIVKISAKACKLHRWLEYCEDLQLLFRKLETL